MNISFILKIGKLKYDKIKLDNKKLLEEEIQKANEFGIAGSRGQLYH